MQGSQFELASAQLCIPRNARKAAVLSSPSRFEFTPLWRHCGHWCLVYCEGDGIPGDAGTGGWNDELQDDLILTGGFFKLRAA